MPTNPHKPNFEDVPDVDHLYSDPNNLEELLKDLEVFEARKDDELVFQNPTGDRMTTVKNHTPAERFPEIYKKPYDEEPSSIQEGNIRENPGQTVDDKVKKEIKKIHEEAPYTTVTNVSDVYSAALDTEAFEKTAKLIFANNPSEVSEGVKVKGPKNNCNCGAWSSNVDWNDHDIKCPANK